MIATNPDQLMKETDPYLAQFERFENEAKQPPWLFPLRKAGVARFAELGFPTSRHEDWRFTNVAPIAKLPFRPVFDTSCDGVTAGTLAAMLQSESALLEKHLGHYVRMEDHAFAALNTAFFLDGAFIHVPAGVIVPEPLQLVFVSTLKETGAT